MKTRSKTTTRKIHSLIATFALVAMGGAGILSVPSASAADQCRDDSRNDMECSFTCEEGETLFVSGNGADTDGWVNAKCMFASASCGFEDGPPYSCNERGTNTASKSGTGKCLGNTGGGSGNMLCGSGSGPPDLLGILDGLLQVEAPCPAFATYLEGSTVSSLRVMYAAPPKFALMSAPETGGTWSSFAWNADTGCQ